MHEMRVNSLHLAVLEPRNHRKKGPPVAASHKMRESQNSDEINNGFAGLDNALGQSVDDILMFGGVFVLVLGLGLGITGFGPGLAHVLGWVVGKAEGRSIKRWKVPTPGTLSGSKPLIMA